MDRNDLLAVGSRVGVYLGVLAIGFTAGVVLTGKVTISACNAHGVFGAPPVCHQWLPTLEAITTAGSLVAGALLLGAAYVDQRVVDWEAIE